MTTKISAVSTCTMIAASIGIDIDIDYLLSDQCSLEEVRSLQDTLISEYNEVVSTSKTITL